MKKTTELLSHETLCNIVDLQKLAMSMTTEKFVDKIKTDADCFIRDTCPPFIDFDWRNLTATICLNSNTLRGSFDIWDEEEAWCGTFFCQSVPFKE